MNTKLVDQVTAMLEDSLRYTGEKIGDTGIIKLLKNNDAGALGYFRYRLAMQVGICLGETSEHVLEVFLYPEMPDEEITVTLPLTLIVRVKKYTAAIESIADALQSVLLAEYRKMFFPKAEGLSILLNVCFIDEDDFLGRKGLAAAVGSLYAPALRVWGSQECRQ